MGSPVSPLLAFSQTMSACCALPSVVVVVVCCCFGHKKHDKVDSKEAPRCRCHGRPKNYTNYSVAVLAYPLHQRDPNLELTVYNAHSYLDEAFLRNDEMNDVGWRNRVSESPFLPSSLPELFRSAERPKV